MNIAVLMGGISPERNVSLAGGRAVVKALNELGHNVVPVDPAYGTEGARKAEEIMADIAIYPSIEELAKFKPRKLMDCINSDIFDNIEVVFIVLHGQYGEDGLIQSLLELRNIPYTGSKVKASAMAIDKNASKVLFSAAGIITPRWNIIPKGQYDDYEFLKELRGEMGNHIVIKPNDQGSTIGITIIEDGNLDDISRAALLAGKYSETVLAERFIEGREITVGVVGDIALPVIEIISPTGFFDYESKYKKGTTEYICPADISSDIAEFTQNLALTAFDVLDCRGFARADFRLDEDGQPFCLEINTVPGFTETSLVPMGAREIGIEFNELCTKIIELAIEDHKEYVNNTEEKNE